MKIHRPSVVVENFIDIMAKSIWLTEKSTLGETLDMLITLYYQEEEAHILNLIDAYINYLACEYEI